jgi:hypothetical protein
MAWKHLNIGKANLVLRGLIRECRRLGRLPQTDPLAPFASSETGAWIVKTVPKANSEIARLETLLGAPGESHQTNMSLPGPLPATGAPLSLPNALPASVAVAIKHLTPPPESGISLEVLSAVIDATWGRGMSANLVQRPIELAKDYASKEDMASAPYSEAAATRVIAGLTANAKRQLAEQSCPEAQATDFEKLRKFAQKAGVRIPGLSFKGMKPTAATLEPQSLAVAQARVDAFMQVLNGEDCPSEHADVLEAARKFFTKTTGQAYTVGATLKNPLGL